MIARGARSSAEKSGERRKKIPHKHIALAFLGVTTPLPWYFPACKLAVTGEISSGVKPRSAFRFDAKNRRGEWSFAASAFELLPAAIEIRENRVFNRLTSDGIKTAAGRFAPKFSIFENFSREGFSLVLSSLDAFFSARLEVTFATVDKRT